MVYRGGDCVASQNGNAGNDDVRHGDEEKQTGSRINIESGDQRRFCFHCFCLEGREGEIESVKMKNEQGRDKPRHR